MIDRLARTLLFEGYVLYPYRADSVKNRQRFSFGTLYPRVWCEAEGCDDHAMQTEVLVAGDVESVTVELRFLHLVERDEPGAWQEAREHAIAITGSARVGVPGGIELVDGVARRAEELAVAIDVTVTPDDGASRLAVRVSNETPVPALSTGDPRARRRSVQRFCLASTHVIYRRPGGGFVSLLDPPAALAAAAARCTNLGAWPVLVGAPGATDAMLASPIILYDYPAIAPESATDLFDATEIDEILTLRILALSDVEKAQLRRGDPRARAILDRCERMSPGELALLHGARRSPFAVGDAVVVRGAARGADALDVLLAGKRAQVIAIEEPIDGEPLFAVVFDDDPGRDLGIAGKPGHRFFYRAGELEVAA